MTEKETIAQRLLTPEGAQDLVEDIEQLQEGDQEGPWELALGFEKEDIPLIIEELSVTADGGG